MTKTQLLEYYNTRKEKADEITLFIHMPDDSTEVIYNSNVPNKIDYICKTYNDNLVHSNCKDIYITDVVITTTDDEMNFGAAIAHMKDLGKKIARRCWNGMFLYYVPAASYPPCTEVAKEAFSGKNVPYLAYIAMKTSAGVVVPWNASQTDVLANDWYIVK